MPVPTIRVTTQGTEFSAENPQVLKMTEDRANSRVFRASAGHSLVLRAGVRLPRPTSGEPTLQSLSVRFRTSSGARIEAISLLRGATVLFHVAGLSLKGDYTSASPTNMWTVNPPLSVDSGAEIRVAVGFPPILDDHPPAGPPSELLLVGAVAEFPRGPGGIPGGRIPGGGITR